MDRDIIKYEIRVQQPCAAFTTPPPSPPPRSHLTPLPPMPSRTANSRVSRTVSSATWKSSWVTYTDSRPAPPPPPQPRPRPLEEKSLEGLCAPVTRMSPARAPSTFLPANRSKKVDFPAPDAPFCTKVANGEGGGGGG